MTKLEELKKRHAELRGQIKEESKKWLKEQAEAIFEKYPAVKEFSWTQYTPHFNDGDACEFSSNGEYPEINGLDSYDKHEMIPAQAFKDVSKLLSSIDDDTLEEMFGDHMKVTAKRGGIEVEEYEHD